jgi:hypothetical protein
MRLSRTFLSAIFLSTVYGISQQNGTTNTMQVLQEWTRLQATWGKPNLQPIPGSSLELVEKLREKDSEGRTIIHYNFKVSGLATEDTYTMEYWPIGGPSHPFQKLASGLRINKDGLIICGPQMVCGDKKQSEYPLETAVLTAVGETNRYLLTSEKNHKNWVTGIATPFPIRSNDGACQLEITRITRNGELLLFTGSGFPSNATITFQGDSAGEKKLSSAHTDERGNFQTAELPFILGQDSGILQKTVTDGANCKPTISTKWGHGSRELQ